MEGVDRLNELKDEMLVNNIMSRLDCTTKELIRTTATISKRWKNLWTQLPYLVFSDEDDDVGPFAGAISWERLKCLGLSCATLDEDMIEKILSGSPSLESLELDNCYGYRQIDITSKSVKNLVFSSYFSHFLSVVDYIDCIKINAPYISSVTIKGALVLRELVLLNVSSLVEAHLDYSINLSEYVMFDEEVFKGLFESLGHVEYITFGNHCSELLSRLKAGSDTSNDDRAQNGDQEEQIA